MKKSFYALFIASAVITAGAQVPSQTYNQQAVLGDGTPVNLRHTQELQMIPDNAPTMTRTAYETRRSIRVKRINVDARGDAYLSGAIRGLGMDVYHFSGNAGDVIDILNQRGGGAMEFAIFRPDIGMRFGNHQVLPQSGDYELRIVNNRRNLPKNKKAYPYQVKFTLVQGNGQYVSPEPAVNNYAVQMPAATSVAQEAVLIPHASNSIATSSAVRSVKMGSGQKVSNPTLGNEVKYVKPIQRTKTAETLATTPVSSAPIVHYTCAQGSFDAAITAKQQAIFMFKGKRAVLPYQADVSNAQIGVYGAGPLVLETIGYQANPKIARLIAKGNVSATNCVAK